MENLYLPLFQLGFALFLFGVGLLVGGLIVAYLSRKNQKPPRPRWHGRKGYHKKS